MEVRDERDLCQNMYKLLSLTYDEFSKCRVLIPLIVGNNCPEAVWSSFRAVMVIRMQKASETMPELEKCWEELCERFPNRSSDLADLIDKFNTSVLSYTKFITTCFVELITDGKLSSVSDSEFASTVNDYQASIMGYRLALLGIFGEWHMAP